MAADDNPPRGAVSTGRGLLYISFAKLWFMVAGYAIIFGLPHLLPQARVGEWALILSWVSPLNNVMVTATIQGVAKFAAAGPAAVEGAKRAALRVQLLVGGGLAILFCLGAPAIAWGEPADALIPGLRLAAVVILAYALYAVFVGAANGARQFHKQAGLDLSYSTLRATLVLGGAVLTHTVLGAVGGFAAAAVLILGLSVLVVGLGRVQERTPPRAILGFMAGVAGYLLITNLLMFVDGWLLKRLTFEAGAARGIADPATYSSELVAIYAQGAQSFARLPYQLMLAVTFVIFPLVSRATLAEDRGATRLYVDRSLRYSLIAVGAMVAGLAARPDALVALMGQKYLSGAPALPPLAVGYLAFALLTIATTILNGAGMTGRSVRLGLVTLIADVVANWAGVSWACRSDHDPLVAAAVATALAMLLGLTLAALELHRCFGASLRLATVVRVLIAGAVAVTAGRLLPLPGRLGLAAVAASGLVFVAALFSLRELSVAELASLRRRKAA